MQIGDWAKRIHCGHVLDILRQMPNNMIDVCVTSPPYWGLRDYGESTKIVWDGDPKCGAWNGQLGLENHPQMYIDHLVQIFREVRRILKKSGSLWLNLGDTYFSKAGNNSTYSKDTTQKGSRDRQHYERETDGSNWLQPKQLMLIPSRVAIALQEDGWTLRNDVIWYKPNHMPSSVRDRLTTSYEHVFFLTKNMKYYFDLDAIRVPHKTMDRRTKKGLKRVKYNGKTKEENINGASTWLGQSPNGKNPADTWRINTKPFKGAHFAVYPTTLIERILKATGPKEVCSLCGKPRRVLTAIEVLSNDGSNKKYIAQTKCNCNVEFRGGLVLDVFMGSGTTAVVAKQLGLNWVGIELNPKYAELAIKRIGEGSIESYDVNRITVTSQPRTEKTEEEKMYEQYAKDIEQAKSQATLKEMF